MSIYSGHSNYSGFFGHCSNTICHFSRRLNPRRLYQRCFKELGWFSGVLLLSFLNAASASSNSTTQGTKVVLEPIDILLPAPTLSGKDHSQLVRKIKSTPSQPIYSVEDLTQNIQSSNIQKSSSGVGAVATIRGVGQSASEVAVESLGIPLNPPQGGGFDFNSFPTYFWEQFEFSQGGSSHRLNSGGVGGKVVLTPWTYLEVQPYKKRQKTKNRGSKFGASYRAQIDQPVSTFFVGVSEQEGKVSNAFLLGASAGNILGWAGAYSGALLSDENHLQWHLLSNQQTSPSLGSIRFPTPQAKITQSRVLPVVQTQKNINSIQWSSLLALDFQKIQYEDSQYLVNSFTNVNQVFLSQNVDLPEKTNVGASFRKVNFESTQFEPLNKNEGHLSGRKLISFPNQWLLEPFAHIFIQSKIAYGGGLGIKKHIPLEFADMNSYFKFQTTPRMPTLLESHFEQDFGGWGYVANHALRPEQVYSVNIGNELFLSQVEMTTEVNYFYKTNSILQQTQGGFLKYQNEGISQGLQFHHRLQYRLKENITLGNRLQLQKNVKGPSFQGVELPYSPKLSNFSSIRWVNKKSASESVFIEGNAEASSLYRGVSRQLPGYWIWGAKVGTSQKFQAMGELGFELSANNLFNLEYEKVEDYRADGRFYVFSIQGRF